MTADTVGGDIVGGNLGAACDPLCSIAVDRLETGGLRLVVRGELDQFSAVTLERMLDDVLLEPRPVHLDLAEVAFIDVAGVEVILRAHRRHGATVRLSLVSPSVERLLRLTRLADHLPVSVDAQPQTR